MDELRQKLKLLCHRYYSAGPGEARSTIEAEIDRALEPPIGYWVSIKIANPDRQDVVQIARLGVIQVMRKYVDTQKPIHDLLALATTITLCKVNDYLRSKYAQPAQLPDPVNVEEGPEREIPQPEPQKLSLLYEALRQLICELAPHSPKGVLVLFLTMDWEQWKCLLGTPCPARNIAELCSVSKDKLMENRGELPLSDEQIARFLTQELGEGEITIANVRIMRFRLRDLLLKKWRAM